MVKDSDTDAYFVISSNPTTFSGCRIGRLAQTYSTYRPKKFEVEYVPACGTTTQGNVIGGTIWAESDISSLEKNALMTSNGGFMAAVYSSIKRTVALNSLPQRLFQCKLDKSMDSEPFYYAIMIDSSASTGATLGKIVLHWQYEFENPVVSNQVEGQAPRETLTFVTQTATGPVEVSLDDSYTWTSLIMDTVPTMLADVIFPGKRYQLSKTGTDKFALIDDENYQPIVSTSIITSGVQALVQAAYEYVLPSIPNLLLGIRDPAASKIRNARVNSPGFMNGVTILPSPPQAIMSGSTISSNRSRKA